MRRQQSTTLARDWRLIVLVLSPIPVYRLAMDDLKLADPSERPWFPPNVTRERRQIGAGRVGKIGQREL